MTVTRTIMRSALFCIELGTAQWERLLCWYRDMLGLKCLVRMVDDGYALLDTSTAHLALLRRTEAAVESGRFCLVFEVDDMDAMIERLKSAGQGFDGPHGHVEGFREVVTTDPDGNRVRLFAWEDRG